MLKADLLVHPEKADPSQARDDRLVATREYFCKRSNVVLDLAATGDVLPLTCGATTGALTAMVRYGMAFWDALIWATARENHLALIYTEDLPGMAAIEGVR